jgi:hypothetical protein
LKKLIETEIRKEAPTSMVKTLKILIKASKRKKRTWHLISQLKQNIPLFESLTSKEKLAVAELENASEVLEKFMVKLASALWS